MRSAFWILVFVFYDAGLSFLSRYIPLGWEFFLIWLPAIFAGAYCLGWKLGEEMEAR